MVEITKKYTCDICGMLLVLGVNDNIPDWTHHTEVGDLCPTCTELWEEHKKDFLKRYKQ